MLCGFVSLVFHCFLGGFGGFRRRYAHRFLYLGFGKSFSSPLYGNGGCYMQWHIFNHSLWFQCSCVWRFPRNTLTDANPGWTSSNIVSRGRTLLKLALRYHPAFFPNPATMHFKQYLNLFVLAAFAPKPVRNKLPQTMSPASL